MINATESFFCQSCWSSKPLSHKGSGTRVKGKSGNTYLQYRCKSCEEKKRERDAEIAAMRV